MDSGVLEVVVYRGKDISGSKPGQLPTSSVEIKLGKEAVGTKVVENNRNPQWNTVHSFSKVNMTSDKTVLELTLRDKKDKFAGRISIPLAQHLNKSSARDRKLEKWFPILNKKLEEDPVITGEIQVKLRFSTQQEEREKEEAKSLEKEAHVKKQADARDNLLEGRKPAPIKKNPFGEEYSNGAIDQVVDEQIQQIVAKTEQVRGESKSSTTRTLQKLGEAQEMAAVTSEKLSHQGEQLERIATDSYKIEDNTKISARQIRGIKSIFGAAANLFSRSPTMPRRKNKDNSVKTSKSDEVSTGKQMSGDQQTLSASQDSSAKNKYADDDIDRDLDQISLGINNLRNIANDMGREIESQTKTIDKLIDQTDRNEGIIQRLNHKIAK